MRSGRSPSHLLFFHKSLGNDLIDSRFREPRGYALTASPALTVVDDPGGVVVDVCPEFLEGSSQFLRYQVDRPFSLLIFLDRRIRFEHQVRQRLIRSEQVTVPEKPFHPFQILEDTLLCDPAFIGTVESARRLRELFDPHRKVEPVEDMLRVRVETAW